jgi:hypothetical protein
MTACGYEVEHRDDATWRAMPPIVRPLVIGRARKAAAATATVSANTRGGSNDD